MFIVYFCLTSVVKHSQGPTADPGVASTIPAQSYTFVETDHEIISTVILLPVALVTMENMYTK